MKIDKIIVGLGNDGIEYENTRHNIGFIMLDMLAKENKISFQNKKYAHIGIYFYKNITSLLLKPTTYMNKSGVAVKFWAEVYKIPAERILVLVDDLNLPFGTLRYRLKGSCGGHNGLRNIEEQIGENYPRIKFGIGSDFNPGRQSDFVLENFKTTEKEIIKEKEQEIITKIKTSFFT